VTINNLLAGTAFALGALALATGESPEPPGGPGEITALQVASELRAFPDEIDLEDTGSRLRKARRKGCAF